VGGAGNPNLVAQQGRLVRVSGDRVDLLAGVLVRPEALGFRPTESETRTLDNHFVRVMLPWSKACELLETPRRQEIHAATIYPGQHGIAELVREVFLNDF